MDNGAPPEMCRSAHRVCFPNPLTASLCSLSFLASASFEDLHPDSWARTRGRYVGHFFPESGSSFWCPKIHQAKGLALLTRQGQKSKVGPLRVLPLAWFHSFFPSVPAASSSRVYPSLFELLFRRLGQLQWEGEGRRMPAVLVEVLRVPLLAPSIPPKPITSWKCLGLFHPFIASCGQMGLGGQS